MANSSFYNITKKDLFDLFSRLLDEYKVFVPYKKDEKLYFGEFDAEKEASIELGIIRQSQPFKSFIASPREKILPSEFDRRNKPSIVAGVKACDLKSLRLQDFVFQEGDVKDPFYIKNRLDTIIISNDCTEAKETCFCLAMDGAPYPTQYFDMNLSPIGDGFIIEVASPKAKEIVAKYKMFFKGLERNDPSPRDANRQRVSSEVQSFIDKRQTPGTTLVAGSVKKNYNNVEMWEDFASTCVECGACNLACPTCHCFLLYDMKGEVSAERMRIWDSCLYKTFARVAGGANPRRHLYERLRNRFDKKFSYFPEILNNYYACTGCGRCIEACPGDIDIREVLKGLVNGKWNKPPHD